MVVHARRNRGNGARRGAVGERRALAPLREELGGVGGRREPADARMRVYGVVKRDDRTPTRLRNARLPIGGTPELGG